MYEKFPVAVEFLPDPAVLRNLQASSRDVNKNNNTVLENDWEPKIPVVWLIITNRSTR